MECSPSVLQDLAPKKSVMELISLRQLEGGVSPSASNEAAVGVKPLLSLCTLERGDVKPMAEALRCEDDPGVVMLPDPGAQSPAPRPAVTVAAKGAPLPPGEVVVRFGSAKSDDKRPRLRECAMGGVVIGCARMTVTS
mmetsp:Transcript_3595/g.6088  ORF Transcript_3595/g.6088 Transcript_3595/m.6088 type:complete len:138 (+) Transcript_3595:444-857(+)